MPRLPLIVVMGVSGSGKSTIGSLLADHLGVPFTDADDLHPASNVAKMSAGEPLTDGDRWPWLALVGEALAAASANALSRDHSEVQDLVDAGLLQREEMRFHPRKNIVTSAVQAGIGQDVAPFF